MDGPLELSSRAASLQCDGFTFSGTIANDKEERLLVDGAKPAAAHALRRWALRSDE